MSDKLWSACPAFFCLCPASALLHITSISLPLLSLSRPPWRGGKQRVFFFVTLHCIDCLTCQCTVQFKPFFSCIAGRSKNIDLWHPTAALYCVFFFLIHWQSEIINRAVSTHTATQLYCFYCIYACSGAKPPFAALKKKGGLMAIMRLVGLLLHAVMVPSRLLYWTVKDFCPWLWKCFQKKETNRVNVMQLWVF